MVTSIRACLGRHCSPGPAGRASGGFTLIELVVVLAMVALLLTLAVPRYFSSLDKGRRSVQAQNIASVRDAIDKFFGDNGRYPDSLSELVDKRYLRSMPIDPVTEQSDWVVVAPSDATLGGVYDIRSSAGPEDGTSFREPGPAPSRPGAGSLAPPPDPRPGALPGPPDGRLPGPEDGSLPAAPAERPRPTGPRAEGAPAAGPILGAWWREGMFT